MNNPVTKIQLIPTQAGDPSGYLDVDQRVPVPITYAISDIRDITKRTGSFSKTITLPGTKNNNILLSHLYDINVDTGAFSVKRLYRCILLEDGLPLHENELSLQLVAVNKIQDNITEDDEISYEVVVRDDAAQFFSTIANKKLTELDFSVLNHNINANEILSTWANLRNYKYILPYRDGRNFVLSDFIPAIYVKDYWDQIHAYAGFSYDWAPTIGPNGPDYWEKLLLPSNRGNELQIEVQKNEQQVLATQTNTISKRIDSVFTNFGPTGFAPQEFIKGLNPWNRATSTPDILATNTIIIDPVTQFNLGTQAWTPNLQTYNNYKYTISFNYVVKIDNTSAGNIVISTDYAGFQLNELSGVIKVRPNLTGDPSGIGAPKWFFPEKNIKAQIPTNVFYPPGINPMNGESTGRYEESIIVPVTDPISDILTVQLPIEIIEQFTTFGPGSPSPFAIIIEITNYTIKIELDSETLIYNQPIDMNKTIPDMTQAEFLKSIYTMYNLYPIPDKTQANKLIYYTRDKYYDSAIAKEKDWTLKMARDVEQKIEFLPELQNKEVLFTYKEDNDTFNQFYQNYTKEVFGQEKRSFDIEWAKGVDTKQLAFGPTPGGVNSFRMFLPYLTPGTAPRILIDGGQLTGTTNITILDYIDFSVINNVVFPSNVVVSTYATYLYTGHFNRPQGPTFDINFGSNPYYFYDIQGETQNNLYNLYWRNTINYINESKMLTAYFNLDAADINQLSLNDIIRIDNSYWNINKIIDYDAGAYNLTQVELISYQVTIPSPPIP